MKNDLKISLLVARIGTILIEVLLFFFLKKKITIRCFKQDKDEEIDENTDNHEQSNIDNNKEVATVTNNTINKKDEMILPVAGIVEIAVGGTVLVVALTAGLVAAVHYRYCKDYHKSDKELKTLGLTALKAEVDNIISECLGKIRQMEEMVCIYGLNEQAKNKLEDSLDDAKKSLNNIKQQSADNKEIIEIKNQTIEHLKTKIKDCEDIKKNQVKQINKGIKDIKKSYNYYLKVVERYQEFLQPCERFQLVETQHTKIMAKVENALGAKKTSKDLEISIESCCTIQM